MSHHRKHTAEEFAAFKRLKAQGLTHRQIAAKIGISHHVIDSWQKGRNLPACMATYHNYKPLKRGATKLTPDKGYVLGVLCGDGHMYASGKCVELQAIDLDFVEHFRDAVKRQYGKVGRIRGNVKLRSGNTVYRCWIHSVDMIRDLVGYFDNGRPLSKTWRIPGAINQATPAVQVAFLRGLYDSDGHCRKDTGQVQFGLCNKLAVLDVQELLIGLGIKSNFYTLHNKKRNKDYYTLHIPMGQLVCFAGRVGFSIRRKELRLQSFAIEHEGGRS